MNIKPYLSATDQETRTKAVAEIAKEEGVSTQAVIAKLAKDGLYKSPTRAAEREYVKAIEIMLSLPANSLVSLEKASKRDLMRLQAKLVNLSDKHNL